ncbi:hypothetical protein GTY41_10135 [Streptomyces sp. SID685]|uniref:phage tail protein n=1 Tax=Streptomyces TaxID=1883 RepID=UPI00136DE226|nr:phage tail protein [Streptomyces sp. SID685]MYR85292.1 hypothetical protein [Streptomyces sp. SID685]
MQDGIYFSELSGINTEIETADYLAASAKKGQLIISKQFGRPKPPSITLKRGWDGNGTMLGWHAMARDANPAARRDCDLFILNNQGHVQTQYTLLGAWPSKVEVSALKAGATEVVTETVQIVCEQITTTPNIQFS